MMVPTSLRQRADLATVAILLAFGATAMFAAIGLTMMLMRRSNRYLADTLLSHYFAYWQDLPAAVPVLAILLLLLVIRGRSGAQLLRNTL